MPRGFLVKRTMKMGPISYRVRGDDDPQELKSVITSTWVQERNSLSPSPALMTPAQTVQRPALGGMPEAPCAPSCSPNRPISVDQQQSCLDRTLNSSSPSMAESFPSSASFFSLGQLCFLPSLADMEAKLGSICSTVSASKRSADEPKGKLQAKKPKNEKKLSYKDEVTTSPVLGLKIKEDPEDIKPRSNTSSPLGEFICQLCKEQYTDPLSLAQHKCSRIIRVEYRCSECNKVFSCPANLASHRRWHKPRNVDSTQSQENAKENKSPSLPHRELSTPSPQPSDSGSEEELFECPHCNKKFRRQAYLRKHLAVHRPSVVLSATQQIPYKFMESTERPLPLQSSDSDQIFLAKERLSTKTDTSTAQQTEIYPCRFCPENFFSSPGLTRHINKCHPSETRQVILFPVSHSAL